MQHPPNQAIRHKLYDTCDADLFLKNIVSVRNLRLLIKTWRGNSDNLSMKTKSMVAVPIGEFKTTREVPVDVYIRLSDDKFVLITKAGDILHSERLATYKEHNIDSLYMGIEDYQDYIRKSLNLVGAAVGRSDVTQDLKTRALHQGAKSVLSAIEDLGFSQATFTHARTVTEATLTLVEQKLDLSSLLFLLNQSSEQVYSHAVAVSVVAAAIGGAMKWEKPATREKLALGGLLHDIGMKELPTDLVHKNRADMTVDEQAIYESHPFRGMQILQTIGSVPDDILSIVYEHHENAFGFGYPRRIRDLRMNPLAKVVSLAVGFCDLTVAGPNNKQPRSGSDAVRMIEETMGQPYNKEAFRALKSLIVAAPGTKRSA